MEELPDNFSMYQACLLHARADRVLRSIVSSELENFQVTMNEWLLLGVVGEGPKTGLSLSEVANALDVSQPQVTALMTKVLKQRLVKQKVARKDKRSRYALLTAKGKHLLEQIEKSIGESLSQWLEAIPREQLLAYIKTTEYISTQKPEDS